MDCLVGHGGSGGGSINWFLGGSYSTRSEDAAAHFSIWTSPGRWFPLRSYLGLGEEKVSCIQRQYANTPRLSVWRSTYWARYITGSVLWGALGPNVSLKIAILVSSVHQRSLS